MTCTRTGWRGAGLALAATMALAGGCGDPAEQRARIDFHVSAVEKAIDYLEKQGVPAKDVGHLSAGLGWLGGALGSLPDKIDQQGPPDAAVRKEAAAKAIDYYQNQILPPLRSLDYEPKDMHARLEELRRLARQVEK